MTLNESVPVLYVFDILNDENNRELRIFIVNAVTGKLHLIVCCSFHLFIILKSIYYRQNNPVIGKLEQ